MWICPLVVSIAVAIALVSWLISLALGHSNFVVTSDYFRQKVAFEPRPRFRDSVGHPRDADAKLTVLDRLFFRQIEGKTTCLRKAKVSLLTLYHFRL